MSVEREAPRGLEAAGAPRAPEQAVREAIARRRDDYLALVRRRAGGAIDAEEVLQGALERALVRASQLREPARAEAWVGRVVRNAVFDQLRRPRLVSVDVDAFELPAPMDDEGIDCRCVLAEAKRLKPEYGHILTRVVVDGLSLGAVARELGLTTNNAAVRLHRAREALKKRMAAHCGTVRPTGCGECLCEERGCCAA